MLEEAAALVLVDGGLRPVPGLWMPDDKPLTGGLSKPELGCLDPSVSTEERCESHACLSENIKMYIGKSQTKVQYKSKVKY